MENIFSPTRFGNLVNKHFREHLRTYLMSLIVFGAVVLLSFIFTAFSSPGRAISIHMQSVVFVYSFMLGSFIFTGSIFSDYNHSRSAFTSTMLPASILEKYLLYWLVSLVGFTVLALGVYHLSQSIIVEYLKTRGTEPTIFYFWSAALEKFPTKLLIGMYLLSHAVAFLGAVSFRKNTVIITAFLALITSAIFTYLNFRITLMAFIGDHELSQITISFPFVSANVSTEDGWVSIHQHSEIWTAIFLGTLILSFWICAYFKLKERQV